MSKRFLLILATMMVIFVGIVYVSKNSNKTTNAPTEQKNLSNNVIGAGSSKVELTEYGDFQCPACLQFEPIMQEIRKKYKDEIFFRFRHFPLAQIHKNALIASRAAEAAAKQGKFWEMHDILYENQKSWADSTDPTGFFTSYAREIGLDEAKFLTDMKSSAVNDIILADLADATSRGFNGTPSFTINGKNLERPGSIEEFYKIIDEAIAEAKK